MFEKKLLPCSKTHYTRFLLCCCTLGTGIQVWNIISLVLSIISFNQFLFMYAIDIPVLLTSQTRAITDVLRVVRAIIGLMGVSQMGMLGAKQLRLHIFLYLIEISSHIVPTVLRYIWLTNLDFLYDVKYLALCIMGLSLMASKLIEGLVLYLYFNSVESLAAQKTRCLDDNLVKIEDGSMSPRISDANYYNNNNDNSVNETPEESRIGYST